MNPKLLFPRYSAFIFHKNKKNSFLTYRAMSNELFFFNSYVSRGIEQIFFMTESIRRVFEDASFLLFTIKRTSKTCRMKFRNDNLY